MNPLGAVVLAAGVSSRMNEFKPMLRVDGKTMISRVVSMMRDAGADPVAVVTGYRREVLEEHLKDSVLFVHNTRYWETQMLDSLLLGLGAVGSGCRRILISPADVPLVAPETVQTILGMEGQFVRPMFGGEPGHPVLLDTELIPLLERYRGPGGLRGAVESGGVDLRELVVDDEGVVLDCDTKDQYTGLLRYRRQQGGRQRLQLELRVGLRAEDVILDPTTAQLLQLIQDTGSLHAACRCMHMDGQKGRDTLEQLRRQLGLEMVSQDGASLTLEGKEFLARYLAMQQEIHDQAMASFQKYFHSGEGNER